MATSYCILNGSLLLLPVTELEEMRELVWKWTLQILLKTIRSFRSVAMPPVWNAHVWKKLLPWDTCHLWRRIKAGQQNRQLIAHRTCPCSCPHSPSNKGICFQTHLSWLPFSSLSSRKEFKSCQQKCGRRKGSFLIISLTKFSQTIVLVFWHMAE